jgi:hypothetical protein
MKNEIFWEWMNKVFGIGKSETFIPKNFIFWEWRKLKLLKISTVPKTSFLGENASRYQTEQRISPPRRACLA